MRAGRLLSIQMLLETRGRMSARVLAQALEVSIRTLYRDVDELASAGVPIYAERGRAGGFALMPGWKPTLTGLTPAEAQAVFLSGLAGPAADVGLGPQVARARLKLLTALPAAWREDAERLSARLYLDPVDWYREADATPALSTVAAALWNERQLSLRYESWQRTASRVLSPLGLVLKAGAWYLVAAQSDQARTYRVSNILEAEMLDTRARRPRGFDLAAYWQASVRRFETQLIRGEATVLATAAGLKQLAQLSSAVSRRLQQVAPPAAAGARVRLRIPIESIEHATTQLLRFAPEVEVLAPKALRQATAERLRRALALYRRP
jgi:predicted DNA-binding transcriptional regulator YafY